jgi:hypothetical protein
MNDQTQYRRLITYLRLSLSYGPCLLLMGAGCLMRSGEMTFAQPVRVSQQPATAPAKALVAQAAYDEGFSDGNYYIVGLHSGSSELRESTRLSNGEVSGVINRGVAVSRWATAAFYLK